MSQLGRIDIPLLKQNCKYFNLKDLLKCYREQFVVVKQEEEKLGWFFKDINIPRAARLKELREVFSILEEEIINRCSTKEQPND